MWKIWQRLLNSSAKSHETVKLELLGAWEPLDNSRPLPHGKGEKPDILFLMETKCRKEKLESIRVRLGFFGMFVVEPVGRSGGLVLFWKDVHELKIQNYT